MTVCNRCTLLLQGGTGWKHETVKCDIDTLIETYQQCRLCRYLCDFFEIPVSAIRDGAQWPYPNQIIKSWREIHDPHHPWCSRKKLEYTLEFKTYTYKYRRIQGTLFPKNFYLKGTNEYYHEPVERPLPLGTGDYSNSEGVLGVRVHNSDAIASRGYWSYDSTPLTLDARRSTITNWIEDCRVNHPSCWQHTANYKVFPSRLIHVGDGNEVHPKLVSTANIGHTEKFITLSHCWGPDPSKMPLRTLKDTYMAFTNAIPMTMLPRTFRDAVSVTRALGIEYIWIDSLCIIQDDLADWEEEAAKMAAIYEGSFLTLAAVDSPNSSAGLFLDTVDGPSRFEFASGDNLGAVSTAFLRPLPAPQSKSDTLHLHNAPLYQRGWVFQEMMLSQRSLHFRKHQMYWRCQRGLQTEDGTLDESRQDELLPASFLSLFSRSGGKQDFLMKPTEANMTWWSWVDHYTSRALTKAEDRIAAFAGIIRLFQARTGDTVILGLWKSTFISDLHWSAARDMQYGRLPLRLAGPSWSWMFHLGTPVFYQKIGHWENRETHPLDPRLESYSIKWNGTEFTSALVSSELLLSGAIRTFTVRKSAKYRGSTVFEVSYPSYEFWAAEIECTFDDGSELADQSKVMCLFLYYEVDHGDTEDTEGDLVYFSNRTEYFLVLDKRNSAGSSASNPIYLDDGSGTTHVYSRRGIGWFKVELEPRGSEGTNSADEYSAVEWPNPPLMFEGCERLGVQLV